MTLNVTSKAAQQHGGMDLEVVTNRESCFGLHHASLIALYFQDMVGRHLESVIPICFCAGRLVFLSLVELKCTIDRVFAEQ